MPRKPSTKRINSLYPSSLTFPALVLFVVFFVVPEVSAFFLSFTDWNISRFSKPEFNGLDNYGVLFNDEYFLLALWNTFVFAVFSAGLKVFLGLLLALAVNRNFVTGNLAKTIFYMPAVLSIIVVGIIFSSLFRFDGLINHWLAAWGLDDWQHDWVGEAQTSLSVTILADVWRWTGFNMAIFLAGLKSIPEEYIEAAKIDGASAMQILRKVTLSLLIPAFVVNATFNTIGGLKVFEQVFVITAGGPGYASQVLSTYIYQAFSAGLLGRSTAMGLILFVIVTVVTLGLNKVWGGAGK
jgi:raffinose/stachyose/melibiose transport system permease protein